MSNQIRGKCLSISLEHTTGGQPFILSAWKDTQGEVRWWTTYLVGEKCVPRAETFLRDLGWEKPVSGEPLTDEEKKELSIFLAAAIPDVEWPMLPGSTFKIHSPATERIASEHGSNGRFPVWAEVGSGVQAHLNKPPRHAMSDEEWNATFAVNPVQRAAREVQEQREAQEAASNGNTTTSEQSAANRRNRRMFVEEVEGEVKATEVDGPASTNGEASQMEPQKVQVQPPEPAKGTRQQQKASKNQRAPSAAADTKEVAIKPPPQAPANAKSTALAPVASRGTAASASSSGSQGQPLEKQIQELKAALQERDARIQNLLKTTKYCLQLSDSAKRLIAEAAEDGARAGTKFVQKILDLWVQEHTVDESVNVSPQENERRHSLIHGAKEAIKKFDALKFVMNLRELGQQPAPSPSKSIEADEEMDYEV